MKDKYFFDTNILVYMQDASDPVKQQKARFLLSTHLDNGTAVISTQCLQEFYNVLANKMKQNKIQTKQIIHSLSENIPVVQITPELIETGIDISVGTQFSFWDSINSGVICTTGIFSDKLCIICFVCILFCFILLARTL